MRPAHAPPIRAEEGLAFDELSVPVDDRCHVRIKAIGGERLGHVLVNAVVARMEDVARFRIGGDHDHGHEWARRIGGQDAGS